MELLCTKHSDTPTLCRMDPARNRRGFKWFCFNCNRYVLPDDLHKARYGKGAIVSGFRPAGRKFSFEAP